MRLLRSSAVLALVHAIAPVWAQTTPPMSAASAGGRMQMPADMMKGMPNDMRSSMMGGMNHMQTMTLSGDVDKDFAQMMKVHHQQALDMAQMQLDKGKSPEMKAMATQIIAAQKKEIAQFDAWLAKTK
jgi:uncharacterized protein (DUF305 family)